MKNIIIVWDSLKIGGVDTYLYYLVSNKKFKKFNITILTNHNNEASEYLKSKLKKFNDINLETYFSFFTIKFDNLLLRTIYFFLKPILFIISVIIFIKRLKGRNFDVLIAQCGNYGNLRSEQASIIAAKILGLKKKIIVIHHKCEKSRIFTKFLNSIINSLIKKFSTKFVTVSRASKKSLMKNCNFVFKNKFNPIVIHNGIPKIDIKKKNYLKKIIKKKNKINICMLSRVTPNKGQEDLINMVIKNKNNSIIKLMNFYLIGDGENGYVEKLKTKCKKNNIKNIYFTGFLNLESIKILTSFDLCLSLTRDYEGFGLTIGESMVAGTPVIATDVGAVKEFLNHKNGTLIKVNNEFMLKKELINFSLNRKKFIKKAYLAKSEIDKKFNTNIMANKYFSLINK